MRGVVLEGSRQMSLYSRLGAMFAAGVVILLAGAAQNPSQAPTHCPAGHGGVENPPGFKHFDYAKPHTPHGGAGVLAANGGGSTL